jgi:hypothetical protein
MEILLVSETHITQSRITSCIYRILHISKAHGGIALIINNSIRHYKISKYQREFLQAASIVVEDWNVFIIIFIISHYLSVL